MTEEINLKTGNTSSVLQEEDQEPILEEVIGESGSGKLRKLQKQKEKKWNGAQMKTTKKSLQRRDLNQKERSDKMQKCEML